MVLVSALAALSLLSASAAPLEQGSREDKNGWIILHLYGSPHQVGFEHGSLAAPEVDDALKAVKYVCSDSGKNWDWYRTTAKTMFWPKLDKEYRDEITGIADGVKSKGGKADADDILAMNSYIELQMYYLPYLHAQEQHSQIISGAPNACSAFVATGSTTVDGKVVMGQNFWWDGVTGERWRVVLDIHPAKGNHIMMDALPGFIESGSDWAINDKGIGFCETTISDFVGFDPNGVPEFERMRKAIQYSASLNDVADIFKTGNNGGYANTWLMVDRKSNEIGKLELGLKNVIFSTSSNGYFVGANFPEDPKLKKEEANAYSTYSGCEARKQRWIKHLDADKGKVNAEVARTYLEDTYDDRTQKQDGHGGGALCAKGATGGAMNAKVLTSDTLAQMSFWGRAGVPDGTPFTPLDAGISSEMKKVMFNLPGQDWLLIGKN